MKVTVLGAAQEVTGSCHLIEVNGRNILLDCGLLQGGRKAAERNAGAFPFDPASLDAVILSHAHIDHSGRLPLLVKRGFRGRIYAHRATRDLCRIMLKDSAFLQEKGALWENRKRARKHLKPIDPLYCQEDVVPTMRRFRSVEFDKPFSVTRGLQVTFYPAAHILGASVTELRTETGATMVFSGDLGSSQATLFDSPWKPEKCDLLLVESTYGDRCHRSLDETWREVGQIISNADAERGNILIPAFAVGRTQQILHMFRQHYDAWGLGRWKIFLDSPLAIEATKVHDRHRNLMRQEVSGKGDFADLPNVYVSKTANQSVGINRITSGAIIIAGSGMCDGGRIKHHLKHNLWRRNCHVIIVGFQAGGTLGRRLIDGARRVSLWGEAIEVGASIHTIGGLSAHADQKDLVDWIKDVSGNPRIVIVHGEPEAQSGLASALNEAGIQNVCSANPEQTFDV